MLHHIEIYGSDLERAIAFWTPCLQPLGYAPDRGSGGVNYVREGDDEPYLGFLPAPATHAAAGYHRKRVGLNHLAFRATSRTQVDALRNWAKQAGHPTRYDDRYPLATAPDDSAVFLEDPDRIKVEVVAPSQD